MKYVLVRYGTEQESGFKKFMRRMGVYKKYDIYLDVSPLLFYMHLMALVFAFCFVLTNAIVEERERVREREKMR